MRADPVAYTLRNIEPDLWQQVKDRAMSEGRAIRFVLIAMLRLYAAHGFKALEPILSAGNVERDR